ncbi:hypothetical protein ARSEF1564_005142 [Beauveria bassiana]
MTTRNLLSGPITFSNAKGRAANVLEALLYPQRKLAFYDYIERRRDLVAEVIAHHFGVKPSEIQVSPQVWWRHGSFNLCIPFTIIAKMTDPDVLPNVLPYAFIRFPLPYRVGEAAHPGNLDEKVRCEAATYAWMEENCPDVPIPKPFGFGLSTNERFTKSNIVPWWSRWCHEARRFILSVAGYQQPTQYVCHNSPRFEKLDIGYLIIEMITTDRGIMLSESWPEKRSDARLHNLQKDMARIMVSMARHRLPCIGTFRMDSGGFLRLDNRPISVDSTIYENEGLPPVMSRNTTFTTVQDFINSQILAFEPRFLEQPNAINSREDAWHQMTGFAGARLTLPQLLQEDLNNGPFIFALSDIHRSNIFVDENWNITAIIDLEFACSWPIEFLQTPYWLECDFIEHVLPTEFLARNTEFIKHVKQAEELHQYGNSGTESLSSIMQRSSDEGGFWVPLALAHPVSFTQIFYERILKRYFGFLAEDFEKAQSFIFCSRLFRRNIPTLLDRKLDDRQKYLDALAEAFSDEKPDLAQPGR